MALSATIRLKIIAPTLWSGTARARDGFLRVDPKTAAKLIADGVAVLCDPADVVQLIDSEPVPASACRDSAVFRVPRGWAR